MKAYESTAYSTDGFRITFPNEWAVSVIWSSIAQADNGKTTAEVAVIDSKGNYYAADGSDLKHTGEVNAYVTPTDLLWLLTLAAEQPHND